MDKIKILEAKENEYSVYDYVYLESDYDEDLGELIEYYSEACQLGTNTIKVFELENALKNYDLVTKKYKLIATLLRKKANLEKGKDELARDIQELKQTNILLNKRTIMYESYLNKWYHLSDGKAKAIEYAKRALKMN